jgi:hypothetical protein
LLGKPWYHRGTRSWCPLQLYQPVPNSAGESRRS